MRISDWSSDVCSSDLHQPETVGRRKIEAAVRFRRPDPRQAVVLKRRPKALGRISQVGQDARGRLCKQRVHQRTPNWRAMTPRRISVVPPRSEFDGKRNWISRSEEHTSELQSLMRISYAVFCLKKKKRTMKQSSI